MAVENISFLKQELVGLHVLDLPTPSFVVKESQINKNCAGIKKQVEELQSLNKCKVQFRPHLKTHKTKEGLLKQLQDGFTSAVLVSTLAEAEYILNDPVVKDKVDDICYTLPITRNALFMKRLMKIESELADFRLFVDNLDQLHYLSKFKPSKGKWSIFLKIDVGTQRAGCVRLSDDFKSILAGLSEFESSVKLYGIYAHAGHSYGFSSKEEIYKILVNELHETFASSELLKYHFKNLVLSIGSTPTIRSIGPEQEIVDLMDQIATLGFTLEIHCGNYCMLDLQQVSTGVSDINNIAGFVLGSVVSSYKDRNESLSNTGVIALTREKSSFKGHGLVFPAKSFVENNNKIESSETFYIDRISQEHGIVKNSKGDLLDIGTQLVILPQHACIVASNYPYYAVINDDYIVTDLWVPCKGW
ncbi:hypothetical protein QEN19_002113 [Hanseniaspora menglaensis]